MTPSNPHTVLIVDTDHAFRMQAASALTHAGLRVRHAISGEMALHEIETGGLPHLAIVEKELPGLIDGFKFCELVHRFSDLPVILVSAQADNAQIVTAIEKYAEDFLIKPINPDVLAARARRILQRLGDFAFDLTRLIPVDTQLRVEFPRQRIYLNGKPVSLTPIETKLLYVLMRHGGETVRIPFILHRMWPDGAAREDSLRVHLHRLRRKLRRNSRKHTYIISERGVGYRFVAE